MSLNPHDRALLEAGREGLEPSLDDRKRLRGAIAAQIGIAATVSAASAGATAGSSAAATVATTGATLASGSGAVATGSGLVAVAKGLTALVLLAGAGALGYRAMHSPPAAPQVAHVQVSSTAPPPAVESPVSTGETTSASASREEPVTSPTVASPAVPSGTVAARAASPTAKASAAEAPAGALSQETHLVADAREALRSGDAARALTLLDDHARRFPRGVLSEERDAERVAALCVAGRAEEARTRAARFTRDYPRSTLGAKVRGACAAH